MPLQLLMQMFVVSSKNTYRNLSFDAVISEKRRENFGTESILTSINNFIAIKYDRVDIFYGCFLIDLIKHIKVLSKKKKFLIALKEILIKKK